MSMKGDYSYLERSQVTSFFEYKEKYKDHPNKVDYWKYRKILSDLSKLIFEEILNNCMGFKLPNRLGTLIIIGTKPKVIKDLYQKRNLQLGRTEGYVYKLFWVFRSESFPKADFFTFKTPRLFQDRMSEYIKSDRFFSWMTLEHKRLFLKFRKVRN